MSQSIPMKVINVQQSVGVNEPLVKGENLINTVQSGNEIVKPD